MKPNILLYRDFPAEVRNPYSEVAKGRDWSSRHIGLLNLAETALRYLASLCFSDYRTRSGEPARNVEKVLERARSRNLTFGGLLALLRESVKSVVDPLIPPPGEFPESNLRDVRQFSAAVDALQAAVSGLSPGSPGSALDIAHHVKLGLDEGGKELGWWEGWERLVTYRNKVAHAGDTRWPVQGHGYWESMGPLLHDALVELLATPVVSDSVLDHPVVNVTLVSTNDSGEVCHAVCGERRGVYFEEDVVEARPATARWTEEHWKATTASPYILEPDGHGYAIRSLFWDLRNGLPPAIDIEAPVSDVVTEEVAESGDRAAPALVAMEGRGTAPGTCGEFAQGILLDGTPFHATCPINKSATVVARLRPAKELSLIGLREHQRKLALAIEYTLEQLDLGPMEVTIRHWSDLDIGKGMGSSTADVLAGIRAIADAAGREIDVVTEGRLAAKVESSDGSMHPGIAAVNHKTCELVRTWDWYPEFVIVMLVPHDSVDTHSISFAGQEALASQYETLLGGMDEAIRGRSIAEFAEWSTESARLNERYLLNPYCRNLSDHLDELGALGVNVGHTGTVCGLLFPNTDEGRMKASEVCFEVRQQFGDLKDVKVVTTPHCEEPAA